METISYDPRGVCSRHMEIDVEDGVIQAVRVTGGCNGNLQGVSALLKGMTVEDAIARMEGIHCGMKPTSCPDQLAQAIKQAMWHTRKAPDTNGIRRFCYSPVFSLTGGRAGGKIEWIDYPQKEGQPWLL